MYLGPIITPRQFMVAWATAAKEGRTITSVAHRLKRKVSSVVARAESLAKVGVILPPLEIGEEPDIMMIVQREFTLLDIADGSRAPCQC